MGIEELHVQDLPPGLTIACSALLALAIACAVFVSVDVVRRPQPMAVMNAVWPLTILFGSLVRLGFYLRSGRAPKRGEAPRGDSPPRAVSVATGTSH
ncbi:MAG TPA: hypothetical protein VN621_01355 [Arthrobacter sp.]|nr:hypothetical protein [Arthrobacter sp.]